MCVNPPERNMVFVSHANPEENELALWLSLQLASEGYAACAHSHSRETVQRAKRSPAAETRNQSRGNSQRNLAQHDWYNGPIS
jgi:hypothetical protein